MNTNVVKGLSISDIKCNYRDTSNTSNSSSMSAKRRHSEIVISINSINNDYFDILTPPCKIQRVGELIIPRSLNNK
jgi:hypothetical protein